MPRLIGCVRCRRAFTADNPRHRPRGRYCESCYLTLGATREWCHHCRRAVTRAEYDYTIYRCVDCRRARQKADYWRDPATARQRVRERYPRRREAVRRWCAANQARRSAYWREWKARKLIKMLRGEA